MPQTVNGVVAHGKDRPVTLETIIVPDPDPDPDPGPGEAVVKVQPMTLASGQPLSPALGIGAFAEKTLVHAGQCTKVNPAVRPEVAGLLGCGVMAGIGAAINTGGIGRGDSIAVIGCGGVVIDAVGRPETFKQAFYTRDLAGTDAIAEAVGDRRAVAGGPRVSRPWLRQV